MSPPAKVMSACSLIWIWLIDGNTYSTGSSIVVTLRSGSAISVRVRHRAWWSCRFRSDRRRSPCRTANGSSARSRPGSAPACRDALDVEQRPAAVEEPQDDLLTPDRRHGGDPDVERRDRRRVISNWPSCDRRRSTMFISAMILMRLASACAIDDGSSPRRAARRRPGSGCAPCRPAARDGCRTRVGARPA